MKLYTDEDLQAAKRGMRQRIGIAVLMFLATVGLLVLFLTACRSVILSMLVCALGAAGIYFYLCMKMMPWARYWHYQSDIHKGRAHDVDCRFVSLTHHERLSDGVSFYEFIVELDGGDEGDEEENRRLFLWDVDKPAPELKPGEKLHIRAFGNYIIALDAEA